MSSGGAEDGVEGDQSVVGAGRIGCGGDADGGPGGGADRGGGGDGWDGDGDRIIWWEDNVAQVTLGTDPNDPLAYAPGLEHHHPIMSMIGDPGGKLERDIYIYLTK